MAVKTQEEVDRAFQNVSMPEAEAKIVTLPSRTLYEARFALETIRDEVGIDDEVKLKIIEPLAKAVGWAEALAYVQMTQSERFQHSTNGNHLNTR